MIQTNGGSIPSYSYLRPASDAVKTGLTSDCQRGSDFKHDLILAGEDMSNLRNGESTRRTPLGPEKEKKTREKSPAIWYDRCIYIW